MISLKCFLVMASFVWIPIFFLSASFGLYLLATNMPTSTDESTNDKNVLKFPSSLEDLSALASYLTIYKRDHLAYVVGLFASAYLYKQTFAIPGSVFMNVLAGALFGIWVGFPMTCFFSASGASLCYLLSKFFGKRYVVKCFPDKIRSVESKVKENRDGLFFFLLFLRLFPMSPNWFMNMAAPIVNIPLHLFFASVFIGLMPYNYICVQSGVMLSEMESMSDILNIYTSMKLLLIAAVALVPSILIKRLKQRKDAIVSKPE